MQNYVIPMLIATAVAAGMLRKVDLFATFVEGAKEGLSTVLSILPALVTLFFAVDLFRSTDASVVLSALLHPVASLLQLPAALLPLAVLRPLSGAGAMAFYQSLIATAGADSLIGRVGGVMVGASETTMYTVGVYYGAAGVKNARHTLPCALTGDVTAWISAALLTRLFFK